MDYIYGQLPEIVDDMIYSPTTGNGTATVLIDNENKKIGVNVLKTPGILTINNVDNTVDFCGSSNKILNIPKYTIRLNNANSESIAYKWALFEYNFETQAYDINCGDIEVGKEDKEILNLENGASLDPSIPVNGSITSKNIQNLAKGSSATGIQSLSFGGNNLNYPESLQVIEIDDFDTKGESTGKILIDIVKIETVSKENKIYYNLTLRRRDTKEEVILSDITTEFTQQTNISLFAHSKLNVQYMNYWAVRFLNNQLDIKVTVNYIQQINKYNINEFNYSSISLCSEANGNQSVSIGQGTHANADQSQAFGIGTITSNPGQMVIGRYNKLVENALFIIGNGTDEFHRSNALVVFADGTVETTKNTATMN